MFNLARQDVAGFEEYAQKIRAMFDQTEGPLCDLLEGLFFIAMADGTYHPREDAFLARVGQIFGLSEAQFAAMRAGFVPEAPPDPYSVLGVAPGAPLAEARQAWKQLVRENHPDQMQARGVPPEAVNLAAHKMAAINRAHDEITKPLHKTGV